MQSTLFPLAFTVELGPDYAPAAGDQLFLLESTAPHDGVSVALPPLPPLLAWTLADDGRVVSLRIDAVVPDVDGDGDVDVDDLLAVLMAWGPCPVPPADCPADVDGSGDVGVDDLLVVLLAWSPGS